MLKNSNVKFNFIFILITLIRQAIDQSPLSRRVDVEVQADARH